jgi:hypothetical protein
MSAKSFHEALGQRVVGAIAEASEEAGFPSRAPRRWRTGRNVQLNLKVSARTAERFAALADRRRVPFGALLEQLLNEVGA